MVCEVERVWVCDGVAPCDNEADEVPVTEVV